MGELHRRLWTTLYDALWGCLYCLSVLMWYNTDADTRDKSSDMNKNFWETQTIVLWLIFAAFYQTKPGCCRLQFRAGNCSPNLAKTEGTPGFSEAHRTCFRAPCPLLWDSRLSTSTDAPPHPSGSRQSRIRLVIRGFSAWTLASTTSVLHSQPPSSEAPSHPKGGSTAGKGWE